MLKRTIPDMGSLARERTGKFPDAFVQEVVARSDIVDLVGAYVPLKKAGTNLVGLCPFHTEKSPSFSVSPVKQFYHCFGCGKHGDVIGFLMDYAAMSFREAVTDLAGKAGLALPQASPNETAQPSVDISPLLQRTARALQFFQHCLKHTPQAQQYLQGRGVTKASLQRYGIGFAPDEWRGLSEAFPDYADDALLVQAGLVRDKEGRRYDIFRNRLIFAIKDPRGRIVGFGGRALHDDKQSGPKYLNSPESAIFNKGSVLFGVHEARSAIQAARQTIVVEGYMDAVMLAQSGIENVVASMGTACTPAQIERLCALSPETVFTFDGDAAGQKAAWRALETCLPFVTEQVTFRFCLLDEGMDPDEVVRQKGAQAMRERLNKAEPLSVFMIRQLIERHGGLATAENKARFLAQGMELVRSLPYGSSLFRPLRDELARVASVGADALRVMSSQTGHRREARGNEIVWAQLIRAITRWPVLASQKVDAVLAALDESDYGRIWQDEFSCPQEREFWKALLPLPDVMDGQTQDVDASNDDDALLRDQVVALEDIVAKQKSKLRKIELQRQFRQGIVNEDAFVQAVTAKEPMRPNATTTQAMQDARAGKVTKAADLDALLEDLRAPLPHERQ